MKKQILISLVLLGTVLTMNAQIYGTVAGSSGTNKVGIGTNQPSSALDVNGTISVSQQGTGTTSNPYETVALKSNVGDVNAFPSINFVNDWQSTHRSWINFNIRDGNHNKITALTINGDGNVGIGTTNPQSQFHIGGNTASQISLGSISYAGNSGQAIGAIQVAQSDGNGGILNFQVNPWDQNGYSGIYTPVTRMTINQQGNVGIGTTIPTYKLDVCGTIRAKEIKVDLLGGCDFVFKKNYKLMSLNELEKFVTTKQHLPEIASEKEMIEDGLNMKEFQMKLLQKMEEMTLYIIEQNKKNEKQEQELKKLRAKITKIESIKK